MSTTKQFLLDLEAKIDKSVKIVSVLTIFTVFMGLESIFVVDVDV